MSSAAAFVDEEEVPALHFPLTNINETLMHTSPRELQIMEVFVPISVFRDSAIAFNQWDKDRLDTVRVYKQVVYLFSYLTERYQAERRQLNECQLVFETVMSASCVDEMIGFRIRFTCKTEVPLAHFLDQLLRENDKRRDKRLFSGRRSDSSVPILHSITTDEYSNMRPVLDFWGTTFNAAFNSESLESDVNPFNPINFFTVALSLKHAMALNAHESQVMSANYFNYSQDGTNTPISCKYPNMNWVFPVVPTKFRWYNIEQLLFPFHTIEDVVQNSDQQFFMQLNGFHGLIDNNDALRDPLNDRLASIPAILSSASVATRKRKCTNSGVEQITNLQLLESAYQECVKSRMFPTAITPMELLKSSMRTLRKQLIPTAEQAALTERLMASDDPADLERLRTLKAHEYARTREMKLKGIRKLKYVLSVDAKGSKALNAIAVHHNAYMKEHNNDMCLRREKLTKNLTSFHECIALLALDLEVVFKVNTSHRDIITAMLAVNQLYFKTKFHCHMLMSGPAQAGKTFGLELLHKLLIEGSSRMLAMTTPKAKTAKSESFSLMVEIFQEILPSTLGIQVGNLGRTQSSATNNTDAESMFKTQLSESEIHVQALVIVDSKRQLEDQKIDCNTMTLVATNAEYNSIPDAILSRFLNIKCVNQKRLDNGGLAGADAREANPQMEERAKRRFRRNQDLCSKVGVAVYCGVLDPISMDVALAMYSKFQEQGEKHYLKDLDVPRHRERFGFLVQSIVTMRSIDTVFDLRPVNSLSSDFGVPQSEPFKLEHLLYLEKHMYAKVEDCVLAFGMLKHQYEDTILFYVIEAIRDKLLNNFQTDPESLARYKQYRHVAAHSVPQVLNAQGRLELPGEPAEELHAPGTHNHVRVLDNFAYMSVNVVHTHNFNRADATADEFSSLAHLLHDVMEPKPQIGDIKCALNGLAQKKVEGRHGPLTPCLSFQNNLLVVAISVIQTNSQDRSKKVLESILNYKGNRSGEYLYGQMLPQAPFLMDSVKVERVTSRSPLKIPTSNYCEGDVSDFLQANVLKEDRIKLPSNPCTYLDQPLDVYGHDKRVEKLNLPAEEVMRNPPSCPILYDEYVHQHDRMSYPASFRQFDARKYQQYKNHKMQNVEALLWRNQRKHSHKNLYLQSETESASPSNSDCDSDSDSVDTRHLIERMDRTL